MGGFLFSQNNAVIINDINNPDSLIKFAKEFRYHNPALALQYAQRAVEVGISKGEIRIVSDAYVQLGLVERNVGELDSAYSHLYKAWQLRVELGDPIKEASALSSIGTVLSINKNHRAAVNNYLKALEIFESNGANLNQLNSQWINLANGYEELDDLDSSKYFIDLQFDLIKQTGEKDTRFYYSLGNWFHKKGQYDSAHFYYNEILEVGRANQDTLLIINAQYNQGLTWRNAGETRLSLEKYFIPALDLMLAFNYADPDIPEEISFSYASLNQFDSAYYYLQLQKQLEDSLFTTQQANHLNLLRTLHEVESTNRQKQLLAANNRALMISLIFAGAIALSLLIGLYLNQRKRTAEKSLLLAREANIQTDMISRLHIQEAEAMQRMNFRLEEEYQKVARSLHDQLGNLLVTARLNVQGLIDQLPAQTKNSQQQFQIADQSLENALQAIRQIAHQMHEGRINQLGLDSVLQELKSTVEASGKLKVELDLIGVEQRLDANHERLAFQIIRELTTNVIKYAQATELSIQVVREADQIEIMIADNGQGFPTDFSSNDYGLGLRSVQADLVKLGGSLEIDSHPQHGATIIIDLPI
ncbi:MAG: ATP-binding protein [Bacteroidia bacterium]